VYRAEVSLVTVSRSQQAPTPFVLPVMAARSNSPKPFCTAAEPSHLTPSSSPYPLPRHSISFKTGMPARGCSRGFRPPRQSPQARRRPEARAPPARDRKSPTWEGPRALCGTDCSGWTPGGPAQRPAPSARVLQQPRYRAQCERTPSMRDRSEAGRCDLQRSRQIKGSRWAGPAMPRENCDGCAGGLA